MRLHLPWKRLWIVLPDYYYPKWWMIASGLLMLWGYIQFDRYYGYDDIAYAEWASRIAVGEFALTNDHFSYRLGLTAPVAVLFSVFGVGDFGAIAFSAACLVGCLYLVSRSCEDREEKFWSVFLLSTSYYTIWYSFKLYPDILVALCHFVVVYAVVHQHTNKLSDKAAAGWVAFAMLYGFMAKETIVFAVPFLVFQCLSDLYAGQNKRFWYHTVLYCAVAAGAFLLLSYAMTGSPWHRFWAVVQNRYFNSCSYDLMHYSVILRRITVGLIGSLFAWQIAHPILFALMYRPLSPAHAFWLKALGIGFLSFNFLSTSYDSYLPMCLEGRHFLALAPIGAVAAAPSAVRFFSQGGFWTAIRIVIIVAIAVGGIADYKLLFLYGLWAAGVLAAGLRMKKTGSALVMLSLLAHPVYVLGKKSETHYHDQRRILESYTKATDSEVVFVSDQTSARIGRYILRFNPKYTWIEYDSAAKAGTIPELIWVQNPYYEGYLRQFAPHLSGSEVLAGYQKTLIARQGEVKLWRLERP